MKAMNFLEKLSARLTNRSFKDFVKSLWIPFVIIFAIIFADLLTKSIVENNLLVGQSIVVIPNFLSITYVLNEGAAFSILEGRRWFFIVTTLIMVIVFLVYLVFDSDRLTALMKVAIALMLGGAVGNLIDRIMIGAVRDFIEIIFFGWDLPLLGESFAVFNIADTAITIGTILIIIGLIIGHHKKEKTNEEPSLES